MAEDPRFAAKSLLRLKCTYSINIQRSNLPVIQLLFVYRKEGSNCFQMRTESSGLGAVARTKQETPGVQPIAPKTFFKAVTIMLLNLHEISLTIVQRNRLMHVS